MSGHDFFREEIDLGHGCSLCVYVPHDDRHKMASISTLHLSLLPARTHSSSSTWFKAKHLKEIGLAMIRAHDEFTRRSKGSGEG